jgi:hypothetical protein
VQRRYRSATAIGGGLPPLLCRCWCCFVGAAGGSDVHCYFVLCCCWRSAKSDISFI